MTAINGNRWYAVQTKPNQEEKAALNLRRQNFDIYLPKYSRMRRHARKVERVQRPLFSGYLFVVIDAAWQRWRAIQSTFGVIRLVCNGDEPAEVPSCIIEGLLQRQGADGCVRLEQHLSLNAGDSVKVVDGAFAGCLGLYEGMAASERAIILLDLLGRKVRTVVGTETIAAA